MSPKNITKAAILVGVVSILALAVSLAGGGSIWWAVAGFGMSFGLIVVSFLRGAYLAAQHRAHRVDLMNECYYGEDERQKNN
jgi:hypothetical protein